ncbi:MAG TPA: hypothetical protein PK765_06285 [bacterium]|nr:hypothetical protein [bacterium]
MSEFIEVTGARTHNLKNLSVRIPKDALTVVTGVSGSGKSSLAFDTIYAEGQRKYLESLSTYARMIAAGMSEDTEVDEIRGLSPTISISQKTVSSNPRSTVGTITEIYDYYRLLYTTIGRQYCPNHPDVELRKHTLDEVVEYVRTLSDGSRFAVFAPIGQTQTSSHEQARRVILDLGYVRYFDGSEIVSVSDERTGPLVTPSDFSVVVDRLVHRIEEDMAPFVTRLKESLEISYRLADEQLVIREIDSGVSRRFSRRATCPECGYSLQSLTLSNFSFNSHHGACPSCHGLGVEIAFREEDIINPDLTLAEGAVLPWTNYLYYLSVLEAACRANKIPLDVPYRDLSPAQRKIVLYGSDKELTVKFSEDSRHKTADREYRTRYEGVVNNMLRRYHEGGDREDSVYSKRIAQYMTEVPCATCSGHRLKPEMLAIRVGGYNI